jgi:hypothetical protein
MLNLAGRDLQDYYFRHVLYHYGQSLNVLDLMHAYYIMAKVWTQYVHVPSTACHNNINCCQIENKLFQASNDFSIHVNTYCILTKVKENLKINEHFQNPAFFAS